MGVNLRQKHVYLPAAFSAGSFFTLILLMSTTSPIDNIAYSIFFFVVLTLFIFSTGYLIAYLQYGRLTSKTFARLLTISLLMVTVLMLRSSQSLSWGDMVVLLLISATILFYSGRRIT